MSSSRLALAAVILNGSMIAAELDCESAREVGAGKPGVPLGGSLVRVACEARLAAPAFSEVVPLPTQLAGFRLTLGGREAPIFSIQKLDDTRIEILAQVPHGVETSPVDPGSILTDRTIEVGLLRDEERGTARRQVYLYRSAGEFLRDGGGRPSILHGHNYEPVSPERPARLDEVLVAFATGVRPPDPPAPDGVPYPISPLAPVPMFNSSLGDRDGYSIVVRGTIGAVGASIEYFGASPGLIGVYQVNFTLPAHAPSTYPDPRVATIYLSRLYCLASPCSERERVRTAVSAPVTIPIDLN